MRSIILAAGRVVAFASSARKTLKAGKAAVLLLSVVALLVGGATAGRGQSALDGFDPNANGTGVSLIEAYDLGSPERTGSHQIGD